jgi:hypothetical protein
MLYQMQWPSGSRDGQTDTGGGVCSQNNCEKGILALLHQSIGLHEQLNSYWIDFREILHWGFLLNLSGKTQVW